MKYRIASVEAQVEHVKVLRMEPVGEAIPAFRPGQWVFLHLLDAAGNSMDKRPYSIASAPSSRHLEFCIEMLNGRFTGKLDQLPVGSIIGVEGPQGRMYYGGEKKAAFVAGGTGISPIMAMLRHIAETGARGEFVLFYSVRTRDRLLYTAEFERLHKKNPCIKVVVTLTRETPAGWKGECGRIGHEMIARHIGKPAEFDWWMCGPVEMIKNMRECLAGKGVDQKRVRLEAWG
ncbi:MAG: FAD-dependent oxidoreductase [Candidatus ainarchaeum sp.]|nr:FAD-dependent oxidoreductase [Candidatus ainarchaeum sp.]